MKSRIVVGLALLVGFMALSPAAAHAEDPVDLGGAYVLDQAGVVTDDDEDRILASLDSLYNDTGIQLFVVYVDSFTGAASSAEWADTSANLSGLGDKDALLAIATVDRVYQVSVTESFPLSDSDLAEIEENALIPELRDDDWAEAAISFADGLAGKGDDSGSLPLWPIVLLVVVAGGGALVYFLVQAARRRKAGETGLPAGQLSQQQLDARASTLLVEIDDSLRTSEQEVGFAVAQFGEEATKDFSAALAAAKTAVAEAFSIRQKLDDAFPETPEEKRALTLRVIELAEKADADLDAQADGFDALREIETNAPAILDTVDASAGALEPRIVAAEATTADLAARYAPTTIATVSANAAQARTLLSLAATTAANARAALAGGGTGSAAVAVRAAQSSVAQAGQLLDAVDTLAAELAEAQTALAAAVDELHRDLAEARAASGDLAPTIEATTSGLAAILPDSARNPIDALQRVERLDETLALALTGVRDRQQREASARSSLDRVIASARTQISTGEQYLSTRRGGIGPDARTRLAAAQQALDEAASLAGSDPVAALAAAHRAASLAQQGTELAQGDVDYFSRENAGAMFGGGSRGGSGSGIDTSAIIGGILGGLLSSGMGGGGGGGWGGGGSWSGGRSSGGRSSGGFGGSSRRSGGGSRGGRRGGGGRF